MKYTFILLISSFITASGQKQVIFHRGDLEYIQEGEKYIPLLDKDKKAQKKFKPRSIEPHQEVDKRIHNAAANSLQAVTDQKSHLSKTKQPENSNQRSAEEERSHKAKKKRKSSRKKSKKKKDKSSKNVSEKEGKTSKSKSRKKSKKKKSKDRR